MYRFLALVFGLVAALLVSLAIARAYGPPIPSAQVEWTIISRDAPLQGLRFPDTPELPLGYAGIIIGATWDGATTLTLYPAGAPPCLFDCYPGVLTYRLEAPGTRYAVLTFAAGVPFDLGYYGTAVPYSVQPDHTLILKLPAALAVRR